MSDPGVLQNEPAPAWSPRRVALLGRFACVLIALVALFGVFYAWTSWHSYGVLEEYFAAVVGDDATLEAADNVTQIAVWLYLAIAIGAGLLFIVWLWRARRNSEEMCAALHTRGRGWVIFSWFVPIISFWFPYQVVSDVWKASNPQTSAPEHASMGLKWAAGSKVLGWWWVGWIGAWLANFISIRLARRDPPMDPDAFLTWWKQMAILDTLSAAFEIGAAVLLIVLIRQISGWQERRAPAG